MRVSCSCICVVLPFARRKLVIFHLYICSSLQSCCHFGLEVLSPLSLLYFFFMRCFHFMSFDNQASPSVSAFLHLVLLLLSIFHGFPFLCMTSFLTCYSYLDCHLPLCIFILLLCTESPLGFSLCSCLNLFHTIFFCYSNILV
jgi:hypothetical protein